MDLNETTVVDEPLKGAMERISHTPLEQLAELFEFPSELTLAAIVSLFASLQENPGDIKSRLILIGFLYYETTDTRWQELFMWFVVETPEHPILSRLSALIMDVLNPEFYEKLTCEWDKQIDLNPNSAVVWMHAALCLSDLEQALQYIQEAEKLEPENADVQRTARRIRRFIALGLNDINND